MRLFGTDGIRGRANEFPITPEILLRVGQSVAQILRSQHPGENRVVVGKDTRISGYMLETALTSGLVSAGVDVLLPGPLPTPAVAHLTKSMGCSAGIMLTASHNPFEDNGIKIFGPDGFKLNDALEEEIEHHILDKEAPSPAVAPSAIGKAYRIDDARGRYIEYAKSSINSTSLRGLKIVIDCGNGASWYIAPLIFSELGAEVIKTGCAPDGTNINDDCGALHPEHAAKLVRIHQADIGISFDGDADRVIFTDATGTPVPGDRILALCAICLKNQGKLAKNTIAVTTMSNLALHQAMQERGIQVITTDVGDRHVIDALRRGAFSFGGETSGHLVFADHATTGDGILSALQVLSMMKRENTSLAALTDWLHEFPQKLTNLPVRSKPPLSSLQELNRTQEEAEMAFGDNGRFLIRYSGTEKKVRILVEHRDSAMVDRWIDRFTEAIEHDLG